MKTLLISTVLVGAVAGFFTNLEKTGKLVDDSLVTYNLDEAKQLNGAYSIQDAKKVTRLRGSYIENKRAGNWYCFDAAGKMVLRYNYTAGKVLSLDQADLSGVEIAVLSKDEAVTTNATVPIVVCSIDQYKAILTEELKDQMPSKIKSEKINVSATITALVDAKGEAKYTALYVVDGVENKLTLDVKEKVFEMEWIPASYNGTNYKSEVKFNTSFSMDPSTSRKRFIWNY